MACGSGLRCSSTGVPITTTMHSAEPTEAGSVVARSRPDAMTSSRTGPAPGSRNGSTPRFTSLTASSLAS